MRICATCTYILIILLVSSNARFLWVVCSLSSIQTSIIFNYTSGKKRDSKKFVSDKVSEKLYPRIVIVSSYKRHFPQELAILSKSAS